MSVNNNWFQLRTTPTLQTPTLKPTAMHSQRYIAGTSLRIKSAAATPTQPIVLTTGNDSWSGFVSTQPDSQDEEIQSTTSGHNPVRRSVNLCRESVEASKLRLNDLITSLDTTGTQMKTLEEQNISLEAEIAEMKTRFVAKKKQMLTQLFRSDDEQLMRTVFHTWSTQFKETKHEAQLYRICQQFEEQRLCQQVEATACRVMFEDEGVAKDKEIARLRDELRVEKEKRLRCVTRNRALAEMMGSLKTQVTRSYDMAKELTTEEDEDDEVSVNVVDDQPEASVGNFIKDKLHHLLEQVDPRYIPRLKGPSVFETGVQQQHALRKILDGSARHMTTLSPGSSPNRREPLTPQWSRTQPFAGLGNSGAVRSLTPQPHRSRLLMADFTPGAAQTQEN
eukprot:GEMP01037936.1.p1 GENE.GEMP01037936.1~~GEMP01037936.1.p1  ORF type:complete len:393 (+),score=97.26 GEMP01037936.1:136-1314(+)